DHTVLKDAHTKLEEEHEQLKEERDQIQEKQDTLEAEHDRLANDHTVLKDAHTKLEEERDQLKEERDHLQEELETLEAEHDRLANDHTVLKDAHTKLEVERDQLKEERDQIQEKQDTLEAEHDRLANDHTVLKDAHTKLEEERDQLKEERDQIQEKQDTLEAEHDRLANDHTVLKDAHTKLEEERDQLKEERDHLQEELEKEPSESAELKESNIQVCDVLKHGDLMTPDFICKGEGDSGCNSDEMMRVSELSPGETGEEFGSGQFSMMNMSESLFISLVEEGVSRVLGRSRFHESHLSDHIIGGAISEEDDSFVSVQDMEFPGHLKPFSYYLNIEKCLGNVVGISRACFDFLKLSSQKFSGIRKEIDSYKYFLQNTLSTISKSLISLMSTISGLQNDLTNANLINTHLSGENSSLQRQLDEKQMEFDDQISQMLTKINELEQKELCLRGDLDLQTKRNDELQKDISQHISLSSVIERECQTDISGYHFDISQIDPKIDIMEILPSKNEEVSDIPVTVEMSSNTDHIIYVETSTQTDHAAKKKARKLQQLEKRRERESARRASLAESEYSYDIDGFMSARSSARSYIHPLGSCSPRILPSIHEGHIERNPLLFPIVEHFALIFNSVSKVAKECDLFEESIFGGDSSMSISARELSSRDSFRSSSLKPHNVPVLDFDFHSLSSSSANPSCHEHHVPKFQCEGTCINFSDKHFRDSKFESLKYVDFLDIKMDKVDISLFYNTLKPLAEYFNLAFSTEIQCDPTYQHIDPDSIVKDHFFPDYDSLSKIISQIFHQFGFIISKNTELMRAAKIQEDKLQKEKRDNSIKIEVLRSSFERQKDDLRSQLKRLQQENRNLLG
ncbi:hypothetical protein ADUPG1_009307, partial [Aduncisulcus paluster]